MSSPIYREDVVRTDAHQARRDALRASAPHFAGASDTYLDSYLQMRDRLDSAPAFAPIPGTLVEWHADSFKSDETGEEFSARMAAQAKKAFGGDQ
jgi:hypothetical protein